MKDMIILAQKSRNNERQLIIENINKIAIVEVAKVLSIINLNNKYNWVITNSDIDATRDPKLTGIKKY